MPQNLSSTEESAQKPIAASKRNKAKTFTVKTFKKPSRVSSHTSLKANSVTKFKSDKERPGFNRTQSNIEINRYLKTSLIGKERRIMSSDNLASTNTNREVTDDNNEESNDSNSDIIDNTTDDVESPKLEVTSALENELKSLDLNDNSVIETPNETPSEQVSPEEKPIPQSEEILQQQPKLNDLPEINNSLTMYRMQSVLSQSVGEERDVSGNVPAESSNNNILPHQNNYPKVHTTEENEIPKEQTHQKDVDSGNIKQVADRSASSNTTSDSSVSFSDSVNKTDSLIFQQSGLTLYKLNTQPSHKNLGHHHTNSMQRTVSQQSLQRQESYLSFKVPENVQQKLQLSNLKNVKINSNRSSPPPPTQRKETPKDLSQQEQRQNHFMIQKKESSLSPLSSPPPMRESSTSSTIFRTKPLVDSPNKESLLSKQTKSQTNDTKTVDLTTLDLSSYLSNQEPELETRTQQKLWLQRENVATLNDSEEGNNRNALNFINQTSKFQYEQVSREFLNIRRYRNPILESLTRIQDISNSRKRVSIDSGDHSSHLSQSAKQQLIAQSISKSLGFSLKDSEPKTVDSLSTDIEDYHKILSDMWNESCAKFAEDETAKVKQQHYNQSQQQQYQAQNRLHPQQHQDSHLQYQQDSSRFGNQHSNINNNGQQINNAYHRGNHTLFGQSQTRPNDQKPNNNAGYSSANGMQSRYHPTTRAQQQQQQQQQHQNYQQQQVFQQQQQQQQPQ